MENDKLVFHHQQISRVLPPSKMSRSYEENRLRTKTYKRRSITEPYICPTCKKVWQHAGATGSHMEYIYEFPKLGCSKRICSQCKDL